MSAILSTELNRLEYAEGLDWSRKTRDHEWRDREHLFETEILITFGLQTENIIEPT